MDKFLDILVATHVDQDVFIRSINFVSNTTKGGNTAGWIIIYEVGRHDLWTAFITSRFNLKWNKQLKGDT